MSRIDKIICVKNISPNYALSECLFKKVCASYGAVFCINMVQLEDGLGYALCEFMDRKNAENAFNNLNGLELDGHVLKVAWAKEAKKYSSEWKRRI
ncbi:RRM domain-containing protein [Meloidogyne graminicola]|uniref:RRM domain-containing protein n=1 Tax=Meloidogyne graminicola TaxID=189291 RepID=A0A8S9ZVN5_9BILA|nr:RRM domain-containing protein [Meloidogyne graminicola]